MAGSGSRSFAQFCTDMAAAASSSDLLLADAASGGGCAAPLSGGPTRRRDSAEHSRFGNWFLIAAGEVGVPALWWPFAAAMTQWEVRHSVAGTEGLICLIVGSNRVSWPILSITGVVLCWLWK